MTKAELRQMAKLPQISTELSPGRRDAPHWSSGGQGIPYSWVCREVLVEGGGPAAVGTWFQTCDMWEGCGHPGSPSVRPASNGYF